MNIARLVLCMLICTGCTRESERMRTIEARLDSLEQKLNESYKPGFGEFMSNIQVHHAKLWFAGKSENWALAEFEVHEISESITALRTHRAERRETQILHVLTPSLDNVRDAVKRQDPALFRESFAHLTQACNDCHRATDFGFNIVRVPNTAPFSNQAFR